MRRRALRRIWPRRRRQRVVTVALPATLLILTILLIILLAPITGDKSPSAPAAPVALPAIFRNHDTRALVRARVLGVTDGDTIDVALNGKVERVRYYGVDAPERNQRCYDDAKRRNRELVGETVFLLRDARERDRYGRLLRYVFASDGVLVDASLVAEGFGVAWREDGIYRDALVALEAATRELDIGCLWGTN